MTIGESATSSSALAKLTVSAAVLKKDPLLSLVASLASPLQLSVSVKKKGSDLALDLSGGAVSLKHRNAILRSLCGMALHDALDGRFLLLGGHSARGTRGASPESASSLAAISSWMSVADSIRTGGDGAGDLGKLLAHLDSYLSSRSFLVPSASATLADLDLALAIGSAAGSGLSDLAGSGRNVRRWLVQCSETAYDLSGRAAGDTKVPPPEGLGGIIEITPTPRPAPFFFYGGEGEDAPAAASAPTPLPAAGAGGGGSGGEGKKGGKKGGDGVAKGGEGGGELTEEQKKATAEKRAKAKAEKAGKKKDKGGQQQKGGGGGSGGGGADLTISALDIRVGRIVKAWEHETAEKLYCEEVDLGEDSGPRKIASGLRPFYKLEEMQDRRVLVLCNLKARNLVGFPSHGMVMCASNADHTAVVFAVPPEGAKIGERVTFDGIEGEPEPENKVAKKKMFEKIAPDLKTDKDGNVVWKGKMSSTSAGPCRALNGMADAMVA